MTTATLPDPLRAVADEDFRASKLSPLLQQALSKLPEPSQLDAARVAVLSELGFKDMEIAKVLGITWRRLEDLRCDLRSGITETLRSDYSEKEIQTYLGVSSAVVNDSRLLHEPTCMVALSGEWNAICSCKKVP